MLSNASSSSIPALCFRSTHTKEVFDQTCGYPSLVSSALLVFLGIVAHHLWLKCVVFVNNRPAFLFRQRNNDCYSETLSFAGMRDYEPIEREGDAAALHDVAELSQ